MTQLDKLHKALELMKEAEDIIEDLNDDDENSLNEYYGYSLQVIAQELNKFSDNSCGYLHGNTTLEEIIEAEGDNWTEED